MYQRRFKMFLTSRQLSRCFPIKSFSTAPDVNKFSGTIKLLGHEYPTDDWTNVTPKIVSKLGVNLHTTRYHPLSHVRQRIVNYFYSAYRNRSGNPVFSVFDNLSPIVGVDQNFDSLLVPNDHPSRSKNDCYYVNNNTLLRAHTTAHQAELVSTGLNNFLVIGDVYRRDEIDSTHYPVFHQVDGVRLRTSEEVFENVENADGLKLFENRGLESAEKQGPHTLEAVKIMEHELKNILTGLAKAIFGPDIKTRWIEEYFPFTHPSWELEIFFNDQWLEILGCGIVRQEILEKCGANDRIGWAFGLGLERLAMCLYGISDIRLFSSTDTGFLSQFHVEDPNTPIRYKPISIYPQCTNDMSFWLPDDGSFSSNDFYEIIREMAGDSVEQIRLVDKFVHPKTMKTSHCYRIVYRHMNRTLRQTEVNILHKRIADAITSQLNVVVRK